MMFSTALPTLAHLALATLGLLYAPRMVGPCHWLADQIEARDRFGPAVLSTLALALAGLTSVAVPLVVGYGLFQGVMFKAPGLAEWYFDMFKNFAETLGR
jgi:hypothetical protein